MQSFNRKEDFQKWFNPKIYLDTFMHLEPGTIGNTFVTFFLKQLADIFNSGKVKGKTLIDIGAGPCIYQQLSACEAFKEIIVTDLIDRNREEYEKWLKKKPDAFDWSKVVKHVCRLEGDRKTWTEKEEQLRKTITKVLKCDVLQRNPVDPVVLPQVDCVLCSLCLEGASKDFETYIAVLKNITSLLKPGGHLVMCGTLGCTFYTVGKVRFTPLTTNEEFLRGALNVAGYDIERLEFSVKPEGYVSDTADYSAYFVVQAKKRNVL
ncbi:nicotinamide N-methyltransferase-like [Rhinophrynus dorsalis]